MQSHFKYLTHNADDERWGFYITVAGSAKVMPGEPYPPSGHPAGYYFSWNNGRVLHEYQINYLTAGGGLLETKSGPMHLTEGSLLILLPGQWHRYKPLPATGWTEHYIGFNGPMARSCMQVLQSAIELPVFPLGFRQEIIQSFHEVLNLVLAEKPGYHQICSGLVMQILGQMIAIKKGENFLFSHMETIIQKACLSIREQLNRNIEINQLADELSVNYTAFRKAFKKYTGLSPLQYHTALRIKQAIHMLNTTSRSVKEISFDLGFCSVFYFSKLFKEKTGLTPSQYRKVKK